MSADATLLDNDLRPRLQSLQARLARDGIVTTLPPPTTVSILLDIASVRFIVTWSDAGVVVKTTVSDADRWDFGFTVPESAWNEFAKPDPGPLNNTAQAIVAQFGEAIISGDKVKWAQYAPFLERILFCLKPERDRGVAPRLPRKSAIKATYLTIDYGGREYRIFYEEAGSGIPMVCLHTNGSDSRQYKYMLEDPELQADFRMIAFDLPWHGRSMPPRGHRSERFEQTVDFYLGIIREFVKALGLDKPVLIGCSIGGDITLVMAGLHSDEYRAICSLEGALTGNPKVPPRRAIWTRHMEIDHSLFLSTWVAGLMSPSSPQDLQDDVLWEYEQGGPGIYNGGGAMLADAMKSGVVKTLGKSKCPLYVFSGDYDYSASPEMSKQAADQLGGEFVHLVNMGHFPMAEDPVRFKAYLMPVLAKIKQHNRSSHGGDEVAEASGYVSRYTVTVASVQAVTRVNAEQASKRTMRRPTARNATISRMASCSASCGTSSPSSSARNPNGTILGGLRLTLPTQEAKALARKKPKGGKMSLRAVSAGTRLPQ